MNELLWIQLSHLVYLTIALFYKFAIPAYFLFIMSFSFPPFCVLFLFFFYKNGPTPASFIIYFWPFQTNIITIFYNK